MRKKDETPKQFQSYTPTRFEYFAGLALQGLITGRSEKDITKSVRAAIKLAHEMESEIDS